MAAAAAAAAAQRQKRMRTSFKHHQLRVMKSYFELNHNPDAKDLKQLSQKTGLSKRVLQVWFQNARAKFRRGQSNPNDPQDQQQQSPNGSSSNLPNSLVTSNSNNPNSSGNVGVSSTSTSSISSSSSSSSSSSTSSELNPNSTSIQQHNAAQQLGFEMIDENSSQSLNDQLNTVGKNGVSIDNNSASNNSFASLGNPPYTNMLNGNSNQYHSNYHHVHQAQLNMHHSYLIHQPAHQLQHTQQQQPAQQLGNPDFNSAGLIVDNLLLS